MICLLFWWISIVIDVFSTAYFLFRNYRNTGIVFVSENTISLSFPMKNMKVKMVEPFADRFWLFSSLAAPAELSSMQKSPRSMKNYTSPLDFSNHVVAAQRSEPFFFWLGVSHPSLLLKIFAFWKRKREKVRKPKHFPFWAEPNTCTQARAENTTGLDFVGCPIRFGPGIGWRPANQQNKGAAC